MKRFFNPESASASFSTNLDCSFFKEKVSYGEALSHNACTSEALYKEALNHPYNRYESYEQYVCTVNVLNAYLRGNQDAFLDNMSKLGKNHDFKIIVNFSGVPYNPFALGYMDALDGRIENTLHGIMSQYIKNPAREACLALLEEKFAPASVAQMK